MEESARQGRHTGGPVPYGYRLEAHPIRTRRRANLGTTTKRARNEKSPQLRAVLRPAGAGFEHISPTLACRFVEVVRLPP